MRRFRIKNSVSPKSDFVTEVLLGTIADLCGFLRVTHYQTHSRRGWTFRPSIGHLEMDGRSESCQTIAIQTTTEEKGPEMPAKPNDHLPTS